MTQATETHLDCAVDTISPAITESSASRLLSFLLIKQMFFSPPRMFAAHNKYTEPAAKNKQETLLPPRNSKQSDDEGSGPKQSLR